MSSPRIAQASIVNGHTINIRSDGVAAEGGSDSAWSSLRSIVTTRFVVMMFSHLLPSLSRTQSMGLQSLSFFLIPQAGNSRIESSEIGL